MSVCFVDIVGYTTASESLDGRSWSTGSRSSRSTPAAVVVDHGGRIIKTIGDEVLFVVDDVRAAADTAVALTRRGEDADDPFPAVRAGLAHGGVVARLGDVFGPTVNVASRLTSTARPGTVLVDQGVHDVLCPDHGSDPGETAYGLRRLRRVSVKGYSRLAAWTLREQGG